MKKKAIIISLVAVFMTAIPLYAVAEYLEIIEMWRFQGAEYTADYVNNYEGSTGGVMNNIYPYTSGGGSDSYGSYYFHNFKNVSYRVSKMKNIWRVSEYQEQIRLNENRVYRLSHTFATQFPDTTLYVQEISMQLLTVDAEGNYYLEPLTYQKKSNETWDQPNNMRVTFNVTFRAKDLKNLRLAGIHYNITFNKNNMMVSSKEYIYKYYSIYLYSDSTWKDIIDAQNENTDRIIENQNKTSKEQVDALNNIAEHESEKASAAQNNIDGKKETFNDFSDMNNQLSESIDGLGQEVGINDLMSAGVSGLFSNNSTFKLISGLIDRFINYDSDLKTVVYLGLTLGVIAMLTGMVVRIRRSSRNNSKGGDDG